MALPSAHTDAPTRKRKCSHTDMKTEEGRSTHPKCRSRSSLSSGVTGDRSISFRTDVERKRSDTAWECKRPDTIRAWEVGGAWQATELRGWMSRLSRVQTQPVRPPPPGAGPADWVSTLTGWQSSGMSISNGGRAQHHRVRPGPNTRVPYAKNIELEFRRLDQNV